MAKGYTVDFDGRNGNGYQPIASGVDNYKRPPKMPDCIPARNPDREKLEQYAWELFKLQANEVADYEEALRHQIPWCYGLAEKFIKYTEEKFND